MQSLINAGIPNPVAALRNGTIGWTLVRQKLELGQSRSYPQASESSRLAATADARSLADRAGVRRLDRAALERLRADATRTTYLFDARGPAEFRDYGLQITDFNMTEAWTGELPPHLDLREIGAEALAQWLADAPGVAADRPLSPPLRGHRQSGRGDAGLSRLGVRADRTARARWHARVCGFLTNLPCHKRNAMRHLMDACVAFWLRRSVNFLIVVVW